MKKVKIYAEVLCQKALDQFNDAMDCEFVVSGALMPDAHLGYSLPIGAVVATTGAIVPAWVGYDIGCGMSALKLNHVSRFNLDDNKSEVFNQIYKDIPMGRNVRSTESDYSLEGLSDVGKAIAKAKKYKLALGTLGSGNHFIEIGYDEDDNIWVIVHSGSRGVGHGLGTHYMSIASVDRGRLGVEFDKNNEKLLKFNPKGYEKYKEKWISNHKMKPKEGHFPLSVKSTDGQGYIKDLNWALNYALENRKIMMKDVIRIIHDKLGIVKTQELSGLINRNHNHAVEKDGLWIHRKGATHAEKGMMGVIPGNMRDGSFIVRGKGCESALCSSSHGAGRVLGRKQARRELNLKEFESEMVGVTASVSNKTIDESPMAYKDIFEVMGLQEDLVEVVAYIRPMINIKSTSN